ncbi:hypothetical protein HDU76_006079 [Blyttiomyces sp. JEL0837]|nr:hypothetical protein HDU76_006079 [Blyttiomyces sp. JEL0837]
MPILLDLLPPSHFLLSNSTIDPPLTPNSTKSTPITTSPKTPSPSSNTLKFHPHHHPNHTNVPTTNPTFTTTTIPLHPPLTPPPTSSVSTVTIISSGNIPITMTTHVTATATTTATATPIDDGVDDGFGRPGPVVTSNTVPPEATFPPPIVVNATTNGGGGNGDQQTGLAMGLVIVSYLIVGVVISTGLFYCLAFCIQARRHRRDLQHAFANGTATINDPTGVHAIPAYDFRGNNAGGNSRVPEGALAHFPLKIFLPESPVLGRGSREGEDGGGGHAVSRTPAMVMAENGGGNDVESAGQGDDKHDDDYENAPLQSLYDRIGLASGTLAASNGGNASSQPIEIPGQIVTRQVSDHAASTHRHYPYPIPSGDAENGSSTPVALPVSATMSRPITHMTSSSRITRDSSHTNLSTSDQSTRSTTELLSSSYHDHNQNQATTSTTCTLPHTSQSSANNISTPTEIYSTNRNIPSLTLPPPAVTLSSNQSTCIDGISASDTIIPLSSYSHLHPRSLISTGTDISRTVTNGTSLTDSSFGVARNLNHGSSLGTSVRGIHGSATIQSTDTSSNHVRDENNRVIASATTPTTTPSNTGRVSGSVTLTTQELSMVGFYRGSDDEECVICLERYQAFELLRELPCMHLFHKECIDPWLRMNSHCPTCRLNAITASGLGSRAGRRFNTPTRGTGVENTSRRGVFGFGRNRANIDNSNTNNGTQVQSNNNGSRVNMGANRNQVNVGVSVRESNRDRGGDRNVNGDTDVNGQPVSRESQDMTDNDSLDVALYPATGTESVHDYDSGERDLERGDGGGGDVGVGGLVTDHQGNGPEDHGSGSFFAQWRDYVQMVRGRRGRSHWGRGRNGSPTET